MRRSTRTGDAGVSNISEESGALRQLSCLGPRLGLPSARKRAIALPLVGGGRLAAAAAAAPLSSKCSAATPAQNVRQTESRESGPVGVDATDGHSGGIPAFPRLVGVQAPPPQDVVSAWERRYEEMSQLAASVSQPSEIFMAEVLQAVSDMASPSLPQQSLIRKLLWRLEDSLYLPRGNDGGGQGYPAHMQFERCYPNTHEMAERYAGRRPFSLVVCEQDARMAQLCSMTRYLQCVINRAVKMEQGLALLYQFGARDVPAKSKSFLISIIKVGSHSTQLVIVRSAMGFWKYFAADERRTRRKKDTVVAYAELNDKILPFMHWRIYRIGCLIDKRLTTHDCFVVERQMLSREVSLLRDHQDTLAGELDLSEKERLRLHSQQAQNAEERRSLFLSFEAARPDLVRSVLCSVLNAVFGWALQIALLQRFVVHWGLAHSEINALLHADEEDPQRLVSLSSEAFIMRWVNYHLTQFKLVATDVLDVAASTRLEETAGETRAVREWSGKDAEAWSDRCKQVRSLQRIRLAKDDFEDGVALAVLLASLISGAGSSPSGTAQGFGAPAPHPGALWPLDERDLEARASLLVDALRHILPTDAVRYMLQPADIIHGRTACLLAVLCSLFLHTARLPCIVPDAAVFDYVQGASELEEASTSTQEMSPPRGSPRPTSRSVSKQMKRSKTHLATNAHPQKMVFVTMENSAGAASYDSLQDVIFLLNPGQRPSDLAQTPVVGLLITWTNLQLRRHESASIQSLEDLKGGLLLFDLLHQVAPDALFLNPHAKVLYEAKLSSAEEAIAEVVVDCATRCTSFPILTMEAVLKGQADILAAFIASLLTCRPSLPVVDGSELHRHLDSIQVAVSRASSSSNHGHASPRRSATSSTLDDITAEADGFSCFARRCLALQRHRAEFQEALKAVRAARALHEGLMARLHGFVADVLARRAHGRPGLLASDGASESQDTQGQAQLFASKRLEQVIREEEGLRAPAAILERRRSLEDLLRKNQGIIVDAFRCYAARPASPDSFTFTGTSSATEQPRLVRRGSNSKRLARRGSNSERRQLGKIEFDRTTVIGLRELTRLCWGCQLRGLGLSAGDVESAYLGAKASETGPLASAGISCEGLADVFVRLAYHANTAAELRVCSPRSAPSPTSAASNSATSGTASFLAALLERHLWLHSSGRPGDMFYMLAYESGVGSALPTYEEVLRSVFVAYASPGGNHDSRSPGFTGGNFPVMLMDISSFEAMLGHAHLMVRELTAQAVQSIVRGVQQQGTPPACGAMNGEEDKNASIRRRSQPSRVDTSGASPILRTLADKDSPEDTTARSRNSSSRLDTSSASLKLRSLARDDAREERIDHPQPLAFMDFIDALVAVCMYYEPNPLVPFQSRFQTFLTDGLLAPLRVHWASNARRGELGHILHDFLSEDD